MRRRPRRGLWVLALAVLACPAAAQKAAKYRLTTNPGLLLQRAEELQAGHYYAAAAPLYERVLAAVEVSRGPRHPDTLLLVDKLAGLDKTLGRYAPAAALYERLVAADREALGSEHPETLAALGNLAGVQLALGHYGPAEDLLQQVLALQVKRFGANSPATAVTLNNLAGLYSTRGRYPEAEAILRRVLRLNEAKLGAASPAVATSLNNLACLYSNLGRNAEAETLLRRALTLNQQTRGADHPDTIATLSNLASVVRALDRPAEAEALLRQALEACAKTLGAASPDAAGLHNNLAGVYNALGQYEAAEAELVRAANLYLDALGPQHPTTATALSNLARLQQTRGRYLEAVVLCRQALQVRLRALGPDHPLTASCLRNLADVAAASGNQGEARVLLKRAVQAENAVAASVFAGSTRRQRAEFAATLQDSSDDLLTLCLQPGAGAEEARREGLALLLQRKGWLLAAESEQSRAWRLAADPRCGSTFRALQGVREELARLVLTTPAPEQEAACRQRRAELDAQQTTLEARLARQSAELAGRAARRQTGLAAVTAALAPGSALVELVQYRPRHYQARDAEPRWGAPLYAAFVLRAGSAAPDCVILGEAARLDRAVSRYRLALEERRPASTQQMTAAAVYDLVWRPLEPLLGEATQVSVAPDGLLNLIPFPALETAASGERHFLGERYVVRLVNSGRDLAPIAVPAGHSAVLFGAPDFTAAPALAAKPSPALAPGGDLPGLLSGYSFPPLPEALNEVREVAASLAAAGVNTSVFTGAQATEARVKALSAPRLVHFATHGFFVPDLPSAGADLALPDGDDPLHHSGLALARAQLTLAGKSPPPGQEDGLLTAGEVCGLDFQGTALAVLSACDTGVGEVQAGEGVMGLRWAFAAAGAQSLVMSLWAVPDEATRALMVDFYQRYLASGDAALAMAEAQRAALARQRANDDVAPWQWGAFVVCQSAVTK